MCLAIPYGKKEQNNQSVIWRTIRTSPLYLLSTGIIIQTLILALFWFALSLEFIAPASLILSTSMISAYIMLSIISFIFFAATMHFYPGIMHSGNIEYLYYGGFFFLSSYNMLFFYLANFISSGLIITSVMVQLLLLWFAFKPLWWSYYWTDKKHKNLGRIVNTLFFLLFTSQIFFLFTFF